VSRTNEGWLPWLFLAATVIALAPRSAAWAGEPKDAKAEPGKGADEGWTSLFDGESLKNWQVADKDSFQTHGAVEVKDGAITLRSGQPFTGIQWTGKDVPKENFEVEVEARRTQGIDIFCGLTVPVGKSHVTLVLGGWGDSVVGLSSINDRNASDNETTKVKSFKNDQWYKVRLRVTGDRIQAWIEGEKEVGGKKVTEVEKVVDVERGDRKFTIYEQLEPLRPLGFFSWETEGALRAIRLRPVKP